MKYFKQNFSSLKIGQEFVEPNYWFYKKFVSNDRLRQDSTQ